MSKLPIRQASGSRTPVKLDSEIVKMDSKSPKMLSVDIERQLKQADGSPDNAQLTQWLSTAYLGDVSAEAALVIVDEATIQTLNRDYREQDKPTNVLSFAANLAAINGVKHLGDIIICAPVIALEAAQQNKTLTAHWAHMAIHGMLHLQDFDHIDEQQAQTMEAKEIELMAKLGFNNPYRANESTLMTDTHNE